MGCCAVDPRGLILRMNECFRALLRRREIRPIDDRWGDIMR